MRLVVLATLLAACVPYNREAQEAHVQRMCLDRNYAYETGYNVGLNRGALDTSWVTTYCAPERAGSIRAGYHAGYAAGIENAPIVVRGSVHHDVHTTSSSSSSSSPSCTFSSDCDDGQSCRSGQCMGNGWRGDACWFSSDCNSDSCDGTTRTCR